MTRPFESLRGCFARPVEPTTPLPDVPPLSVAAFSDDLCPAPDLRLSLRVCILPGPADALSIDFTDTPQSADPRARPFALPRELVELAAGAALSRALGSERIDARLLARIEVLLDPTSWICADRLEAPGPASMTMARIYDTVLGALAGAWPTLVGAGSCSLGAVVELGEGEDAVTQLVGGGEGATPRRPGRTAWLCPLFVPPKREALPQWLSIEVARRPGSGGVGARNGGDGEIRIYRTSRNVPICVGYDRIDNPPHGIERAGPPTGSEVRIESDAGHRPVLAWAHDELLPGQQLVVATCGGAGHGFPGWGDIEWNGEL